MRLAEAFPTGRFSPPATPEAIAAAEMQLAVQFPPKLRDLYLECDGFREPKGNAKYLLPLAELVTDTRFLWDDLPASIPDVRFPDFKPFVFFGSDGIGGSWGVQHASPYEVIYWHHDLLDEGPVYESRGDDIVDVMKEAFAFYDEAENYDID